MKLVYTGALAVFLLMCSRAAFAQENTWVEVATSDAGTVWKVREKDLYSTSKNPKVWFLLDYSKNRSVKYRQSKVLISFNFDAQTFQNLSIIDYNAGGEVVNSRSHQQNTYLYEPIAPDTVLESAMLAVCPNISND